jgi:hypothetical protein
MFTKELNIKLKYLVDSKIIYIDAKESAGNGDLKFPNHLSKRFLFMCRTSKWLFSHFGPCQPAQKERVVLVPNHYNFHTFSIIQIRQFCAERLISFDESNNKDTKKCREWISNIINCPRLSFQDYDDSDILWYIFNENNDYLNGCINLDPGERSGLFFDFVSSEKKIPPRRLFEFSSDILSQPIIYLVKLLLCIISRSMNGSKDIDRHVKMFLTIVNGLDQSINLSSGVTGNTLPMIINKMNFITLLNLQSTVDRYGNLRNLWELGGYGEGSIGKLKQLIHSTKDGFAKNVILKYLRGKSLSNACSQLENNVYNTAGTIDSSILEMLQVLESVAEKTSSLNGMPDKTTKQPNDNNYVRKDGDGQTIAGYKNCTLPCAIESGEYVIPVIIHKTTGKILIYFKEEDVFQECFVLKESDAVKVCGADYFYFTGKINGSNTIPAKSLVIEELVVGLMLRHYVTRKLYYVINWSWEELIREEDGSVIFSSPRFLNAIY